jgi:hypothetical protein
VFRRDSVGGECLRADRYVRETPLNLLTPSFFLVMKPITSQARLGTRHTRRSKLSERSTVCVIRRDAACAWHPPADVHGMGCQGIQENGSTVFCLFYTKLLSFCQDRRSGQT